MNETEAAADISGAGISKIADKKYVKLLRALPVIDLDKAVLGKENPYWRKWIEHPADDGYWETSNFLDRLKDFDIPVFHQSGWFDGDGIGSKLNYLKMASHGHSHQKLVLGPWGHTDTAGRIIRGRDFGENAIIDLQRDYVRWFDRWLKEIENGIEREPLVSLFVMGEDEWLHGATYPLEVSHPAKLYLAANGKLTFDAPGEDSAPNHYRYDPGDPTPDPQLYQESEEDEKRTRSLDERKEEAEAYHRRIAEERNDTLVYETDPLPYPLTFAGPVSAMLNAASSAVDTDWFVTLSEIAQDGRIFQLVKGKIRARFRKSVKSPELLTPNEIHEYSLDLWQTGICIPEGGRLRIEVASAAFPFFSRNLNKGGHNETGTNYVAADQTIDHDRKHPSYIVLPVVGGIASVALR